MHYIIQ